MPKTNSSTPLPRFAFRVFIALSVLGFLGSLFFMATGRSTSVHFRNSKVISFTSQTPSLSASQTVSTPPTTTPITFSDIEVAPVTTTDGSILPTNSTTSPSNPLGTPQGVQAVNPVKPIQISSQVIVPSDNIPIPPSSPATPAIIASVKQYIQTYFPPNEANKAIAIATCESGMNPSEVSPPNNNGSRDWGVFELNDGGTLENLLAESNFPTTNLTQALNPQWNVQAAALLFSQRGWAPWVCAYKTGIVGQLYTNIPGPNANM